MPDSKEGLTTLVVRRTLAAPVSAVFRAWTDPSFVSEWSWGSEHETMGLELDLRVDGSWKQEIRNRKTGERWHFDGRFQEVIPDRRLVHTFFFKSAKGIEEGPSLVAIDFRANGPDRTDVVITHSRLAVTSEEGTQKGWEDVMSEIEKTARAVRL